MAMKIYSVEDVEKAGNSIMPHHRHHIFKRAIKNVSDIAHSHEKDLDQYKGIAEGYQTTELPPIVVDRSLNVMDGNHRLYYHEEQEIKKIKVFEVAGEMYPEEQFVRFKLKAGENLCPDCLSRVQQITA